jgi:hypothetical protein
MSSRPGKQDYIAFGSSTYIRKFSSIPTPGKVNNVIFAEMRQLLRWAAA